MKATQLGAPLKIVRQNSLGARASRPAWMEVHAIS